MSETSSPSRPEPDGNPFFEFDAFAQAHYERALDLLRRFDEDGDVAAFFYAALELRFAIESRLHAYVDAALRLRQLPRGKSDYVASKLLQRLRTIEPDAEIGSILTITEEGVSDPQPTRMAFTPVTRKLAADHGRLGELLHSQFFRNNPYWYLRRRPSAIHEGRTLLQYRDFLSEVVEELSRALSGTLLSHPVFTQMVEAAAESTDGPAT